MILTGHQPNYLPYLGFFHKIAQADIYAIWDTVQFIKGGPLAWINRNRIKTANGWIWLTVPVVASRKFGQRIMDTYIYNQRRWSEKHWNSIYQNYNKAPYFKDYSDFFCDTYKKKWDKLVDLNETIIRYLIDKLGIRVKVIKCSNYNPKGEKTELIIDMCKRIGADTFLFGIHGRDYADEELLKKNGIKPVYQEFRCPIYHQLYGDFIPDLSIIDLLFNHGPESLDILMGKKR